MYMGKNQNYIGNIGSAQDFFSGGKFPENHCEMDQLHGRSYKQTQIKEVLNINGFKHYVTGNTQFYTSLKTFERKLQA